MSIATKSWSTKGSGKCKHLVSSNVSPLSDGSSGFSTNTISVSSKKSKWIKDCQTITPDKLRTIDLCPNPFGRQGGLLEVYQPPAGLTVLLNEESSEADLDQAFLDIKKSVNDCPGQTWWLLEAARDTAISDDCRSLVVESIAGALSEHYSSEFFLVLVEFILTSSEELQYAGVSCLWSLPIKYQVIASSMLDFYRLKGEAHEAVQDFKDILEMKRREEKHE